jgi:hypothetical protein
MASDAPFEEESVPEGAPEPWRPPVRCPGCRGLQTRFVTMNYEMSVYECESCGLEFEHED